MRVSLVACVLAVARGIRSVTTVNSTQPAIVDDTKFATTEGVKHPVDHICKGGLRLPGTEINRKVVEFIKCQLLGIPGLSISSSNFQIGCQKGIRCTRLLASRLAMTMLILVQSHSLSQQMAPTF